MDLMLKTARAVGMPTQSLWAQVHSFDRLFLVLVLGKNPGREEVNLAAAGRQFFLRLEEEYIASKEKNLATLRGLLEKLLGETTDVGIQALVAAMVVDCPAGEILYLACLGGHIFIRRGGRLVSVLHDEQKTLVGASGFVANDDLIFLASSQLGQRIVANDEKLSFLKDNLTSPQEIADEFLATIQTSEEREKLAVCIVHIEKAQASSDKLVAPLQVKSVLPQKSMIASPMPKKFPWAPAYTHLSMLRKKISVPGRRGIFLAVTSLLVASLMIAAAVTLVKRGQTDTQKRFAAASKTITEKYDEGIALIDLNPTLSQKTLREAKDTLEAALPQFPDEKSGQRKELLLLKDKIDQGLRKALQIETIAQPPLYFDLTLVKDGATGASFSSFENKVLVVDKKNSALYTLSVPGKQSDLIAGNIQGLSTAAIGAADGFILSEVGIERVGLGSKKREQIIKKDDQWGDIGNMVFFSANLYLLDKGTGSIYKYQGIEGGFGPRKNYLAADVKPDFKNATSLLIDGAVWVLSADGRISKYIQGAPQNFAVSGLDTAFVSPRSLFTDEGSKYLYILDSGNKRVVQVDKQGTYKAQYQWDGIKDATDLFVSEKEKKILLLTGAKIYGIDLK